MKFSNSTLDLDNPFDPGAPGFVGTDGLGQVTESNFVNPIFVSFATGVEDYSPAPGVVTDFSAPSLALGAVTAEFDDVVSLGELSKEQIDAGVAPGQITLTFDTIIGDGEGADLAVFENGFEFDGGTFAELAYVEVSTDGINFARFPSISQTPEPLDSFGVVDSTDIFNLAGKHVNNAFVDDTTGELSGESFGTPFDLGDLSEDPLVKNGLLDLNEINFVRLVDIPGSGDFLDSKGNPIFDPFPQSPGGGGFDLDAIGVINEAADNETLIGGKGQDTFVLAAGEGTDTIFDFRSDLIELPGGVSKSDLTFSDHDIFLGDEVLATLTGIDTNTLTESDFTLAQDVTLPPPAEGSFSTVFDFLTDDRLVTFNGFEVSVQNRPGSSDFEPIGTLPSEFSGGSPAFIVTAPDNSSFVIGTGADGNIFTLPKTGGEADLITNIPLNFSATFDSEQSDELFINRGTQPEGEFSGSEVERLLLSTGNTQTIVEDIPGASAGVGFDEEGNLYTGIGSDPNEQRTGEIRRFSSLDVEQSIQTSTPLDFDDDGEFVTQVLSATGLVFDEEGDLWVGGGDLSGNGQQGFIAEVDPQTGEIIRRVDPSDGDPDSGPQNFFQIGITDPISSTIGATDFFDSNNTFFEIDAFQALPLSENNFSDI